MNNQIKAKKSLGQNFLKSGAILNEIIKAGDISQTDFVVEIGPGKGALTEKILETGATVIAIEKDNRLISLLNEKFSNQITTGKLQIIEDDILLFNIEENLPPKYKLVANIPYYITGQIIEKFLSSEKSPANAILMIQKEVCDRIIARDNKESILSISVKAFCEPKYIKKVPARFFSPSPKVDSAIIKLQNISKKVFNESGVSENNFFEIVKAGFSHKRKILLSNLKEFRNKKILNKETSSIPQNLEKKFEKCEIDKKIRAEKLSVQDWICLLK